MRRADVKNMPKLKLQDLLRRRKSTLHNFLFEFGISTYEQLVQRCERIGVVSPDLQNFVDELKIATVEEVIPVVQDSVQEEKVEIIEEVFESEIVPLSTEDHKSQFRFLPEDDTDFTQKKTKKKKDNS